MRALFFLPLVLTGCLDSRPRQEAAQQPISLTVPTQAPDPRIDGLSRDVQAVRTEVQASSNNNQNSIAGIGANISKVAEKVQGFGGDLAHLENTINTKIDATLTAQANVKAELVAQLKADLKAEIQNTMTAQATLQAKLLSDLMVKIETQAQAQVGLKNELQEMTQNIKAGRDSFVQVTQFSQGMVDVIQSSYKTQYYITLAMGAVIVKIVVILGYRSRTRAESRYEQVMQRFVLKGDRDAPKV